MKYRMQDRTEFGEQITVGRLPAIQIATRGCDWNLVARFSREVSTTIVIGGDESPDCSLATFEMIDGQSFWLPAGCRRVPEAGDSGAWPHCVSLQRRDVDLGTVQLSGASLQLPATGANSVEDEHANPKMLTRFFREDAAWLADIRKPSL